MAHEEEDLRKPFDANLMRRLPAYIWPYWPRVAGAVALLLVVSVLQVAGPLFTKLAVDRYLVPATGAPSTVLDRYLSADPVTGLTQISVLFLGTMLLGLVASFFQSYLMQTTGQRAMLDLRRTLMEHLQRLDLSYFDRQPVGKLVTRVTNDVAALNDLFTSGVVAILGDVLVLSFLTAAMLRLSTDLTIALFGVIPLMVVTTRIFRRSVQVSYRRIRRAVAAINSYLQEHLAGMSVVQLYNREERCREEFDRANAEHMEAFKQSILAYGWFYPVVEFLGMLALAVLLAVGGFRIERGELTLGTLIAFFQYAMRFFRPIQDLSEKYNLLQSAMAAGERVFQLLDQPVAIQAPVVARRPGEETEAIEFEGVWFAYQGEDWVLRDVSFRIEPGQTVAVVGHTGAGKTTLANLLLRFYDVTRGAIRIGGVDLRECDPRELRRLFAVVLQDPFLFTGDIEANIRLGTKGIGRDAVEAAAAQVNLLDYVNSLEGGFAHPVRERGAGLSTGQKQLISFARALAHRPRYLILDEATSSVDTETELRVQSALETLLAGRTALVIAHRLSTIQRADRILVMHKGELRESGTHQELLAKRGLYWRLYELQYKDQERGRVVR